MNTFHLATSFRVTIHSIVILLLLLCTNRILAQDSLADYTSVNSIANTDRYLLCQQGDTCSYVYDRDTKKSYPVMFDNVHQNYSEANYLGERKGEPIFNSENNLFGLNGFYASIWEPLRDFELLNDNNNNVCLHNDLSNDIWVPLAKIRKGYNLSVFNNNIMTGDVFFITQEPDYEKGLFPVCFEINMPLLNYPKHIRKHILYWIADCYADWTGEKCCFNIKDNTTEDELCENIKRKFVQDSFAEGIPWGINKPFEERISIERILNTRDYASFVMQIDKCEGGTGVRSLTYPVTFDLNNNRRLTLSDFFNQNMIPLIYNYLPNIMPEEQEGKPFYDYELEERTALGWDGLVFFRTIHTIHGGIRHTFVISYDSIAPWLKIRPLFNEKDNSYNIRLKFEPIKDILDEYENDVTYWSPELIRVNSINWRVDVANAERNDKEINGGINRNNAKLLREKHPTEAINIYKKLIEEHESKHLFHELLYSYTSLARMKCRKGGYDEAITVCKNVIDSLTKEDDFYAPWEMGTEEKFSPYIDAVAIMTDIAYRQKQKEETIEKARYTTKLLLPYIQENLPKLTRDKRNTLWQHYHPWLTSDLTSIANWTKDDSLCVTAYNAQLYSKGLLLNAELAMYRHIQEEGSVEQKRQLKEYLKQIDLIEKYRKTGNKAKMIIAEEEKKLLEKQLMEYNNFADYMQLQNINVNQVARNLREGEVAIEFADVMEENDTVYYALTLQANDTVPDIIKLCSANELRTCNTEDAASGKLHRLIWQPLQYIINGKKTIFFSPIGLLHTLPIEWATDDENNINMSSLYDMYRLSSTREIVHARDKKFKNEHTDKKNALLVGGLNYDVQRKLETTTEETGTSLLRSAIKIEKVQSLPATQKEIQDIEPYVNQLTGNGKMIKLMGDRGTETVFRCEVQQMPNILHIATHGFYLSEKDFNKLDEAGYLSKLGKEYRDIEEKGLVRSGLIFAGINQVLKSKRPLADTDDGIMTAMEIGQMNLYDVDLAVLSACQTAQGEITDDGVMGLQRGFKKAGVNSILMSLWEVDDEATHLFMTKFYEQLALNRTKQQALSEAQQFLQNNTPYNNPKYWAAFILLDAIR